MSVTVQDRHIFRPTMDDYKTYTRPTQLYRSSIDTVALNCSVFEKIAFLHFGVKIQDSGSPPSWILGSNKGFFKKPMYDFL